MFNSMAGSAKKKVRFLKLKKLIAQVICSPLMGKLIAAIFRNKIPTSGCIINTAHPLIRPEMKAFIFWRMYESAEVRFVKRYLRKDIDVVELGSSIGVVSSHIAKQLKPFCRLFCVEANPHLLDTIRINLKQNAPDSQVSLIHSAINYSKDWNKSVNFELGKTNTTSHVSGHRNTNSETLIVPSLTLNQILENYKIDRYAIVSDIEGAEAGMILNDEKSFAKCEQIIIELHKSSIDGKDISVEMLSEILMNKYGFITRNHFGNVFVFER